ncbi:MAG: SEC-C domain-containing protein [Clostridiaceae bacterium]|nr:SEC-C domain-containing protein [Clostridiaceae bacterium]
MNAEEKIKLVEALEKLKEDCEKRRQKRIDGLWREIVPPNNLASFLNELTKAEIDEIRKKLELKSISKLKKQELIEVLIKLIPEEVRETIDFFDVERYNIAKIIYNGGGFVTTDKLPLDIEKIEFFKSHGLIFPGLKQGVKGLFMPTEIMEAFVEFDDSTVQKSIQRNEEWIGLTKGALFYYGITDVYTLEKIIIEDNKGNEDLKKYIQVINKAMTYHKEICHNKEGYYYYSVGDSKELAQRQEMRSNLDYYSFTKEQLLKAGAKGYVEQTPEINDFIAFLNKHYRLSIEESEEILQQCITLIKISGDHNVIMDYLQERLTSPTLEITQQLVGKVTDIYNNTRMWELKGHTPVEVSRIIEDPIKPLVIDDFSTEHKQGKVIDLNKHRKIGRNEACPCGSNKKHKKCCGK